jgi:hypothetical protein
MIRKDREAMRGKDEKCIQNCILKVFKITDHLEYSGVKEFLLRNSCSSILEYFKAFGD